MDVPVPPVEKITGGGFPFGCLVHFKEVDNELVELFIVETIVRRRPVSGIVEGKVKLRDRVNQEG